MALVARKCSISFKTEDAEHKRKLQSLDAFDIVDKSLRCAGSDTSLFEFGRSDDRTSFAISSAGSFEETARLRAVGD